MQRILHKLYINEKLINLCHYILNRNRDDLAKLISDLQASESIVKKEEDSENSQDSVYTGMLINIAGKCD